MTWLYRVSPFVIISGVITLRKKFSSTKQANNATSLLLHLLGTMKRNIMKIC